MNRRWLHVLIAICAALFFANWFFRVKREQRFDSIIKAAARRYSVDPALVKAVIWRESRFDAGAQGRAGEMGLMQICEPAAYEWVAAEKKSSFTTPQLFDPGTNIHAGAWYLSQLLKRYRTVDDPLPYALADYNAGRTHVLRWMQGAAKSNSVVFLAQMDFPGTRAYIKAVSERFQAYRSPFGPGGE